MAVEETISLYLDLEPGKKADFEVVGRTAAAFAEAVKEIAYLVEPGLEIKLEFESGTDGSLFLNAILKGDKAKDRSTLIVVIVAVSLWFVGQIGTYVVSKLLDRLLIPEQRNQLSDEDIDRIARAMREVQRGRLGKEQVQQVYRELERDTAITRVGTTVSRDKPPTDPVPRSEFPVRAGIVEPVETSPRRRSKKTTERLTLISPVLLEVDRVWRLKSPVGEFGYVMKAEKFLHDLLHGKRRLMMEEGIQLTATIETHEVLTGGVWVIKQRDIHDPIRIHRKKVSDLFTQPKKPKRRKAKKR